MGYKLLNHINDLVLEDASPVLNEEDWRMRSREVTFLQIFTSAVIISLIHATEENKLFNLKAIFKAALSQPNDNLSLNAPSTTYFFWQGNNTIYSQPIIQELIQVTSLTRVKADQLMIKAMPVILNALIDYYYTNKSGDELSFRNEFISQEMVVLSNIPNTFNFEVFYDRIIDNNASITEYNKMANIHSDKENTVLDISIKNIIFTLLLLSLIALMLLIVIR